MRTANLEEGIRRIVAKDPRYPYDAYVFVHEAIDHTQRAIGRNKSSRRHIGGKELLEGIRHFALKSYGPMVPTVFDAWGIHSCEDFGEIVFNMIEQKVASASETDRRDDFKGGYSFDDAFRKPFLPARAVGQKTKPDAEKLRVGN